MTDPWARSSRARVQRPPTEAVEIELDGPHGGERTPPADNDDEPNWRVAAGASAVVGLVLGLVIAGALFWGDGDDGEPPSTTVPADEGAVEITTPPTLPPVETVPPRTVGDLAELVVETREVTVPTYVASGELGNWGSSIEFDTLDTSLVASLTTDSSADVAPVESQIRWDATNRRFEFRLEDGSASLHIIYDVETTTWFESLESTELPGAPTTGWTVRSGDQFATDFDPFEHLRRLVLGPVDADNVDQAVTASTGSSVITVRSVPTVRTAYRMPTSAIEPFGRGDDDIVPVEVFIDENGRIVLSQLVSHTGRDSVVVVHSSDRAEVEIDLPSEEELADVEATGARPGPSRPVYESVVPPPTDDPGRDSVEVALAADESRPPAAATVDVFSIDGTTRFSAQRDDRNDRRLMTRFVFSAATRTVQIDDGATATTFVTDDVDGVWTQLSSTGPGGRLPPVDERMVSGLLPRGAIDGATVLAPDRYVVLTDGNFALETHLELEAGAMVLPSAVPMVLDPAERVEVFAYVASGTLRELHILSNRGNRQVLVQRFDLGAEPEITLPDPSDVVPG